MFLYGSHAASTNNICTHPCASNQHYSGNLYVYPFNFPWVWSLNFTLHKTSCFPFWSGGPKRGEKNRHLWKQPTVSLNFEHILTDQLWKLQQYNSTREVADIYCNSMGPLVWVYSQHHDWWCLIFSAAFHIPWPGSSGRQQVQHDRRYSSSTHICFKCK